MSPPFKPTAAAASDADLVRAAREPGRGGKEAFVEIVRRHQTAACAVAWSVTGRMGLADDIEKREGRGMDRLRPISATAKPAVCRRRGP